ncbi:MAG: hypothetical protein FWG50_02370 [Kiritimatiellaeota bacterium]|nr:hypothetical protein [Kiritimatiellota bacterium]
MDGQADDGELSRMEWKIEQEKLTLVRERIALEQERLEAMRERVKAEGELRIGQDGRMTMRLSSVALSSIICLLVGGILGAFSMSVRHDRRTAAQERSKAARVQEIVQSLNADATVVEAEVAEAAPPPGGETNETRVAAAPVPAPRPLQVKTITKGSGSGISLIVVQ